MVSWQIGLLLKWQVDEMASWWIGRLTKCRSTSSCFCEIVLDSLCKIWRQLALKRVCKITRLCDFRSKCTWHKDKSAASFCLRVAARVQDMFCNFYLLKNTKIGNNSAMIEAREKIRTDLESLEFCRNIWCNFKTIKFYLIILASIYFDNQAIYWVKYPH